MRDSLTVDDLRFTPPALRHEALATYLRDRWNVEGDFKVLTGERDQNLRVRTSEGSNYVLKIASPIENPVLVDLQVQALLHLEKSDPGLPVPRMIRSVNGNVVEMLTDDSGDEHAVRLLSYVPGVPLATRGTPSLDTISKIGALQGRMCRAFTDFNHDAGSQFMPWDILNNLVVSRALRTEYLRDGLAKQCESVLKRLENQSLPRMHDLPHQIIHNDAHAGNIMVDPDDPSIVTGVIDFGDLVDRPIVVDLSTSLASMVERSPCPVSAAAALVHGFQRHMPIPVEQLELLYDASLARAIMTVQLFEFRVCHTNVDPGVVSMDLPNAKSGLRKLLGTDEARFLDAVQRPAEVLAETMEAG